MPTKLQPQTVYVPFNPEGSLPDTLNNVAMIPVAYKLPGVYPLTGKELDQLLLEYSKCNTTIKEFLKSKGIEI